MYFATRTFVRQARDYSMSETTTVCAVHASAQAPITVDDTAVADLSEPLTLTSM